MGTPRKHSRGVPTPPSGSLRPFLMYRFGVFVSGQLWVRAGSTRRWRPGEGAGIQGGQCGVSTGSTRAQDHSRPCPRWYFGRMSRSEAGHQLQVCGNEPGTQSGSARSQALTTSSLAQLPRPSAPSAALPAPDWGVLAPNPPCMRAWHLAGLAPTGCGIQDTPTFSREH